MATVLGRARAAVGRHPAATLQQAATKKLNLGFDWRGGVYRTTGVDLRFGRGIVAGMVGSLVGFWRKAGLVLRLGGGWTCVILRVLQLGGWAG